MKKVAIGVFLAGVVSVGTLLAFAASLDNEALGREAIRRVNEIEGVTLEAEEVSLRPFSGLKLEHVRAYIRIESGELAVSMRSLRLRHRLLPLLRRQLVVSSAYLGDPTLELISGPGEEAPTAQRRRRQKNDREGENLTSERTAAAASAVDIEISSLRIENAHVLVRHPGAQEPESEITGFDLELQHLQLEPLAGYLGLAGSGTFAADHVQAGDSLASNVHGLLEVGEGRLRMTDVGLNTETAELAMRSLEVDLATRSLHLCRRDAGGDRPRCLRWGRGLWLRWFGCRRFVIRS